MDELENRLRNWGRWCRVWFGEPNGQTGSIEGNYRRRSEDEENDDDAPRTRGYAPDAADAWAIECACRVLPLKDHLLLKLRYVARANDAVIVILLRRRAGIRLTPRDLQGAEGLARSLLLTALEMPAALQKQRVLSRVRATLKNFLTPELECA